MMEATYTAGDCSMGSFLKAIRIRPRSVIAFTPGEKVFVVGFTDTTLTVVPHRWWMGWLWLKWWNYHKRQRTG